MLERIPEPYSVNAADAADRLGLIVSDLRLIELAVEAALFNKNNQAYDAIVMRLRDLISQVELLADDIIERDGKGGES